MTTIEFEGIEIQVQELSNDRDLDLLVRGDFVYVTLEGPTMPLVFERKGDNKYFFHARNEAHNRFFEYRACETYCAVLNGGIFQDEVISGEHYVIYEAEEEPAGKVNELIDFAKQKWAVKTRGVAA